MTVKTKFDDRWLKIDCEKARRLLVGFLKDEITKAGFQKAVIGLSGGVDSSLSAALSAEALGAENVLGVILPYKDSDPGSVGDARLVAKHLGIGTKEIDITPMVDPYFETHEPDAGRVRRGNVMARQRMIVLYDLSQKEKALVVGTSNRTEMLLGYSTLFGDSACALNPLGDLLKTQVWQMARHMGIPEKVVSKPASADLWQGQTDEEELGIDYETADRIILLMVDQRMPINRVLAHGFGREKVDKVARMIKSSQFKRLPPVIAKLGHRTVNRDFRYPRDWGL